MLHVKHWILSSVCFSTADWVSAAQCPSFSGFLNLVCGHAAVILVWGIGQLVASEYKGQQKCRKMHMYMYASSGSQTHDPSVRAAAGCTFRRPHHCSDQQWFLFRHLLTLQELIIFRSVTSSDIVVLWWRTRLFDIGLWILFLSRCFDSCDVLLKTKDWELLI